MCKIKIHFRAHTITVIEYVFVYELARIMFKYILFLNDTNFNHIVLFFTIKKIMSTY